MSSTMGRRQDSDSPTFNILWDRVADYLANLQRTNSGFDDSTKVGFTYGDNGSLQLEVAHGDYGAPFEVLSEEEGNTTLKELQSALEQGVETINDNGLDVDRAYINNTDYNQLT